MGSSAKKSDVCARFGAAGFVGAMDGMPDMCDWVEWLDEGGDMLAAAGGGVGRGSPALEVTLLLRGGGGGVGCTVGTVARGAARFRVVTISSGRS